MGSASFVWSNFLGGEWSPFAQGRMDLPKYKTALSTCLNAYPIEEGCCPRRPGFQYAATTRNGLPAKLIPFNFSQQAAYKIEFTDGHMRFFNGPNLVLNAQAGITTISTATPAVLTTAQVQTWATKDQLEFQYQDMASTKLVPYLANRQFSIVQLTNQTFALYDPVTGAPIKGTDVAWATANITVGRVLDITTPYTSGIWGSLRLVQTDNNGAKNGVLLQGSVIPQILSVTTLPTATTSAQFALANSYFLDGPYLAPVSGSLVTPSATSGSITITLSFQLWSSLTAYKIGDFVTSGGIGYVSLIDANVNQTPASVPTAWAVASAGQAVNSNGFLSTDIGRLVRLYNPQAPGAWASGTTYNAGDLVTSSSVTYQSTQGNNTNNTPSATSVYWTPFTVGWTWGKITGLSSTGAISGTLAGSVNVTGGLISGLTGGGGVNAVFDGVASKLLINCATAQSLNNFQVYIGKNYTGASAQVISSATIYPSSDFGWAENATGTVTISLRVSNSAPTLGGGTVLGTQSGIPASSGLPITFITGNGSSWNYAWFEIDIATFNPPGTLTTVAIAQVQFFGSGGIAGTAATVAILGPPLPNTSAIIFQMGLYSNTTGWPTCGCYKDGRLWLAGSVPNRVDSSCSNQPFNFAPTNSAGVVGDGNAISGTFNSNEDNTIFWLDPNLQGIVAGTQEGEYLIQTGSANVALTPANAKADLVTSYGCANVLPARTGLTTMFVQKYGRKVQEYLSDIFSGRFFSPNASQNAQHLTLGGVQELAYEDGLENIVWARTGLGRLIGCTYNRITLSSTAEPLYQGWHRHTLGSGRLVSSICVGPSDNGALKSIALVTYDSSNIYHVEVARPLFDEEAAMTDAWFLDDAVVPVSGLSTTVNGQPGITFYGLHHINHKQVDVFVAGLDLGTWTVSDNSVFVPYSISNPLFTQRYLTELTSEGLNFGDMACPIDGGLSVVPAIVGFTYTTQGQLVRPNDPAQVGGQNGPGFGKLGKMAQYAIMLWKTQGISVGTKFTNLHPVKLRTDGDKSIGADQLFSGTVQDTVEDNQDFYSQLCWQITRPFPATVLALGGFMNTSDK